MSTKCLSFLEPAHGHLPSLSLPMVTAPITIDTGSPLSVILGVGVQENLWRAEVSS